MSIIRIGSSAECEIWFDVISPKDSVWAIICPEENNMLVLHRKVNSVQCFVNNNEVADKYWIRYGDVIIINGFRLDWQFITQLLNEYSVVQGNRVKPIPCVYGPPIPVNNDSVNHRRCNNKTNVLRRVRWKIIGIIVIIISVLISVVGKNSIKKHKLKRELEELLEKEPVLYGPPPEMQEEILRMQEQLKELKDSLDEIYRIPSRTDE